MPPPVYTPAQGYAGKIGMGSASPVTNRFDVVDEQLVLRQELINGNGIIGSRSHDISRVRKGLRRVGGPLKLQPNSVEWGYWLQYIFGGTPTGSPTVTYPLADVLPEAYVTIDRINKVFTYDGCKVNKATIRGRQGEPVELELDILGYDETIANAGTFPAINRDQANGPFVFSDMILSLGGTSVTFKDFEFVIDNKIDPDRFFNSLLLTARSEQDREVMLRTMLPYGDWSAIYDTGAAGVHAIATATNGNSVLTLDLAALAFPAHGPNLPGRREAFLPIEGRAYLTGATKECVCTLLPTP